MIQSSKTDVPIRVFVDVKNLTNALANNSVWIRGRLHTSRAKGNKFYLFCYEYFEILIITL